MADDPTQTEGYREAWSDRRFRVQVVVTAVALPLTLWAISTFLVYVEQRPGVVLDDPVLAMFTPSDTSDATFALIYGGILLALFALRRAPYELLRMVQAYVLLVLMRMACMWVTPLEAPVGIIPLVDPLVGLAVPGEPLEKDLFFSGHTSTLFLTGLAVPSRRIRAVLWAATAAVAFLLLRQRVHYTVDVLVAPLAAFAAFWIAGLWRSSRRVSG